MPRFVEYAKTDRSCCKGCRNYISKDELRIGTKNSQQCNNYHLECYKLKKDKPKLEDYKGYDMISEFDQTRVRNHLATF